MWQTNGRHWQTMSATFFCRLSANILGTVYYTDINSNINHDTADKWQTNYNNAKNMNLF